MTVHLKHPPKLVKPEFDIIIESPLHFNQDEVKTIGSLLFEDMLGRGDDSTIIQSHLGNRYFAVTLKQLRKTTAWLMAAFKRKNICRGQTIILLTYPGCNEMFTALFFTALSSAGCRVFMPMFPEASEFTEWLKITEAAHVIVPELELGELENHHREKDSLSQITMQALNKNVPVSDILRDFSFIDVLENKKIVPDDVMNAAISEKNCVSIDDEALIISTSGTSGKSKLLIYKHSAFYLSCLSWQEAGFFSLKTLGGTGFTPLFTHTMGIRAYINALWTGRPVCLIITEWFLQKPDIVCNLLSQMKPAHITGGPAVYNLLLELFRNYPELKTELNHSITTLVSSGALYNPDTSNSIYDAFGLHLHNAYGTTETQQAFSTLSMDIPQANTQFTPIGKPLPGVSAGLIVTDPKNKHYRLYIKSVFGHSDCLNDQHMLNGYFDTGDIVMLSEEKNLFYVGRATNDYYKDNFGVKIPLSALRKYYDSLIENIYHVEIFPLNIFPGQAALLFVNEPACEAGQIFDRGILEKYGDIIREINNKLKKTIEPFEFQHRHICRISVINGKPPLTWKGTISILQINQIYKDIIDFLSDNLKDSEGIQNIEA